MDGLCVVVLLHRLTMDNNKNKLLTEDVTLTVTEETASGLRTRIVHLNMDKIDLSYSDRTAHFLREQKSFHPQLAFAYDYAWAYGVAIREITISENRPEGKTLHAEFESSEQRGFNSRPFAGLFN